MAGEQTRRPHIAELDPLRACTALSVVAVHVLFFTAYLNSSTSGYDMQNALTVAFHFTREVFIFVTAFALVYVYSGRAISALQFWQKRALGVVLPYVIWSLIYVLVNTPLTSPGAVLQTSIFDILTGSASYQLYYILLTLQFYLFFPWLLPLMHFLARRPWLTLSISFTLQVLLFLVDYHTIQSSNAPFWQAVSNYQDRFFLVYQFYFVLGAMTAFYFQQVRAFILRHNLLILGAFVAGLAVLWLHFAVQLAVYRETVDYASSVLQPIMVFYSLPVIFFAFWLACRWVARHGGSEHPRSWRFWRNLSDASFGVYLIHALILSLLLKWMVPALPSDWFEPLRVFLIWFLTAGGALALSMLLLRIPVLSRLVGRPAIQKRATKASGGARPSTEPAAATPVLDKAAPDATVMHASAERGDMRDRRLRVMSD